MSGHGVSAPDACSVRWDAAAVPSYGTAPAGGFWLALEQNGPWGRKAATESRLDPTLGAVLEEAVGAAGGTLLLIRQPDQHAEVESATLRRVYLAGGLQEDPWLLTGLIADPAELLTLPLATLGSAVQGDVLAIAPWLAPAGEAVLLVCANARRDICCAVRGRPIALDVAALRPGRVWECSHLGGHRFAPTGIVLPLAQVLARLTTEVALAALDAAEQGRFASQALGPWHDRGRTHREPALSVADSWIRAEIGETDPTALRVLPGTSDPDWITVEHRDGRRWRLRVTSRPESEPRPESCGKPPVISSVWEVVTEPL
ncbi:MAG: sucrase ferredoxin [Micropruina sp.]